MALRLRGYLGASRLSVPLLRDRENDGIDCSVFGVRSIVARTWLFSDFMRRSWDTRQ